MEQLKGQMSLFDIFKEENNESPVLLSPGQLVYLVIRGDVETYKVSEHSWDLWEGKDRGYDLLGIDGNSHNTTWNRNINEDTFLSHYDAVAKASDYINSNDCILSDDMYIKKLVAYKHTYLEKEIVEWYAILDNDMVYFHYGCMYDHISSINEIAAFEKKVHENNYNIEEIFDYKPKFKNMYRCCKDCKWMYASAHYQYMHI